MPNTHIISFEVNATLTQEISITKENLTIEQLIQGLKDGDYCTTTGHKSNEKRYILDISTFTPVAEIVAQEVDDAEYEEFTAYKE